MPPTQQRQGTCDLASRNRIIWSTYVQEITYFVLIMTRGTVHIASIRAYGAQEKFDIEIRKRINKYTRTSLTFYHINRWVSIRIDMLGAVFSGIISTYLVYGGHLEAGYAGFTLSIVLSFTSQLLTWVRLYNILEIEGVKLLLSSREYSNFIHSRQPIGTFLSYNKGLILMLTQPRTHT